MSKKQEFKCIHCGVYFCLNDAYQKDYEEGWYYQQPDTCDECAEMINYGDPNDPKLKLYKKLIDRYQSFTKWVLRHTPEIKESQRGKDYLKEIDSVKLEIVEFEK